MLSSACLEGHLARPQPDMLSIVIPTFNESKTGYLKLILAQLALLDDILVYVPVVLEENGLHTHLVAHHAVRIRFKVKVILFDVLFANELILFEHLLVALCLQLLLLELLEGLVI